MHGSQLIAGEYVCARESLEKSVLLYLMLTQVLQHGQAEHKH